MNKETKDKIKTVVHLVVVGLVDLFASAAINNVVDHMEGPKIAKIGAKAGGLLVGTVVSDKIADCICDQFDEVTDAIEDAKKTASEAESET